MKQPFDLPTMPIDRYEVRWWSVDPYFPGRVHECRAVYHVNTRWETLYPHDDRPGEPFVNHWQVFRDGHFTGRTGDGWHAWPHVDWTHCYRTRAEAVSAACELIAQKIEDHTSTIAQLRADEAAHRGRGTRAARDCAMSEWQRTKRKGDTVGARAYVEHEDEWNLDHAFAGPTKEVGGGSTVTIGRRFNGSGPTYFGGVEDWPCVDVSVPFPAGREDLASKLAARMRDLIFDFVRENGMETT